VRETLRRAGCEGEAIGTVMMGHVIQAGNRMNPARQAAPLGDGETACPSPKPRPAGQRLLFQL
jgi:acetyl-CoA C-acetyltransferase